MSAGRLAGNVKRRAILVGIIKERRNEEKFSAIKGKI
jgi:hypothetical protein